MVWGSIIGLLVGVGGILAGQFMEGGHIASLAQGSALCIVLSGTIGAVVLQNGLRTCRDSLRMTKRLLLVPASSANPLDFIVKWAEVARREGLLKLENEEEGLPNPFHKKALRMLVDGVDASVMEEVLEAEIAAYEHKWKAVAKVWESAGGYSPTIGILGAVLGLIHVMENLTDPAKLGAGIAVAFVATIYGVAFANLVFLPVGSALRRIVVDDIKSMEAAADGFLDLARGRSPREVQLRMDAHIDKVV